MFGERNDGATFVNVKQGLFTVKAKTSDEQRFGTTPTERTYEYEGKEKTEFVFQTPDLRGKIENVYIRDTEYGFQLSIDLNIEDEIFKIGVGTKSNYGRTLMERLPGIDLEEEVILWAYDFENEGKRKSGISVKQGDEKIGNFFFDYDKKKILHGYPEAEKKMDKDDWGIHFALIDKFLKKYVTENISSQFKDNE